MMSIKKINFYKMSSDDIDLYINNYNNISSKFVFNQMIIENGYPLILRCGHNGIYNRNEQSSLNAILNKIKFV